MQKLPYLLTNRNHTYYIRIVCPRKSGRREFRFSLHTQFFCVAKIRYFNIMPLINNFKCVLLGSDDMNHQREAQLIKAIKNEIDFLINSVSENAPHWRTVLRTRQVVRHFSELADQNRQLQSELRHQSTRNKKSAAIIDALASSGRVDDDNAVDNETLKSALKTYISTKAPEWRPRTLSMKKLYLLRFVEIMGLETLTQSISGKDVQRYREILEKLPANVRFPKSRPVESALIADWWGQLATQEHARVLAPEGLNSHFSAVRSFLTWIHSRHLNSKDYSSYLKISKRVLEANKIVKTEFNAQQLKNMLGSYLYSDHLRSREKPKDFHFWLPLIALTTGMRVGEIASLEKQDIYQMDGAWVFDINSKWHNPKHAENGLEKGKKNKWSERIIPIPQTIINAGFLNFVSSLSEHQFVLNDLHRMKNKPIGEKASLWFNDYFLKYVGIGKTNENGSKVSLHSMRHTFVTRVNKTQIGGQYLPDSMHHYLTGHEQIGTRNRVYNHGVDIATLKQYMDAIDYEYDLSGIAFSRFTNRRKG
ncbi:tyrosine-type recombinase/integrase [Alteromonas flava]|uniref:tyrosine-type recombinase/integrase n=1 Tax=Alteromonas flava TaxID=2048003 RepID=UPI000C294F62|nr:tyrosine-type recombinase/integrase [Alteromonas flava]